MLIKVDPSSLRRTKWNEYAFRFFFGGGITVIAGILAKKFGPEIGGLFLAFPAIFPAAATLAKKHEMEKKNDKGLNGMQSGINAAGAEAAGAALGSIGLIAFALIVWALLRHVNSLMALSVALLAWALFSATVWFARKRAGRLFQRDE